MGRPSKYESHVKPKLTLIEAWARDGLNDEQIYTKLGISHESYYNYKAQYNEFAETLKRGKEVVDIAVENALYKRAMGYTFNEVTKERVLNKDTGEYELQTTKTVVKEVAADTTAQIFWLKNRKPAQWRDKQDIEFGLDKAMQIVFNIPRPTEAIDESIEVKAIE